MARLFIKGGKPLNGEVLVRGAKNSGFKLAIASLMANSPSLIGNFPKISETRITFSAMKSLGASFEEIGEHTFKINPHGLKKNQIPYGIGEKSRSSTMFVPSLLFRFGRASVPLPGGDKIGGRPIDRHLLGLEKLGVKIEKEGNWIHFSTPNKLQGCRYRFEKNTHTGTDTLIMAAAFAEGETVLENAASEPEVDDLIDFINKMGGQIKREDEKTIVIRGVKKFQGISHVVLPDRNEAVTFACIALGTGGRISIFNIRPEDLTAFTDKLRQTGAKIEIGANEIMVESDKLLATEIETTPHPGFMTDWQPLWFTLMTQARGKSKVVERIYPSRFHFGQELIKMGAKIKFFNPTVADPEQYYNFNSNEDRPEYFHGAEIFGPTKLKAVEATVNDLRAGATLVMAGLIAEGTTVLAKAEHVFRGYENFVERLIALGAEIKKVRDNKNGANHKS